jgi:hypothetical protein
VLPGRDGRPSRHAIIRDGLLTEENDAWTESRRSMGAESLAADRKTGQPRAKQKSTSETGLTVE